MYREILPAEIEYFAIISHKPDTLARIYTGTTEITAFHTHYDQLLH